MHELGICDALLKMIRSIAKDEGLDEIKGISVEVGSLSGVVPAYLSDCWTAVAEGTELEKASFTVDVLEGMYGLRGGVYRQPGGSALSLLRQ